MHKHSTPVCRKCKIKGGGKKIDVSLVKEVPLHNHKRKTMRKKKHVKTSQVKTRPKKVRAKETLRAQCVRLPPGGAVCCFQPPRTIFCAVGAVLR